MLITVAELPEYQRRAGKLLSESERDDIVNYERVDLSQAERNDLAKLVEVLVKTALD